MGRKLYRLKIKEVKTDAATEITWHTRGSAYVKPIKVNKAGLRSLKIELGLIKVNQGRVKVELRTIKVNYDN